MAQEHQEYIQSKVNPILEKLVTQVLLERPEEPVPFMVKWLCQQSDDSSTEITKRIEMLGLGEAEQLRSEIHHLKAEIKDLEGKLAANTSVDSLGDEDDEDEDVLQPAPPADYLSRNRPSVSAEAYGDWNKPKEFIAPVHAKTESQKQRLRSTLAKSFLFNSLAAADLDVIVDAVIEKPVEAGSRLIREGDDGDVLYVIETGSFDCLKMNQGEETVVKHCGPGDFFGELALLYNCPRAASVDAKSTSMVWQLDRDTFNQIVRDGAVKRREQQVSFLRSVDLFNSFSEHDRSQLTDYFHSQTVEAGEVVITQGQPGDKFYLVEEGELVVRKTSPETQAKDVTTLRRCDYFGELALIRSEVRAASVVAVTHASLLWIDKARFKRLLTPLEAIMQQKAKEYA